VIHFDDLERTERDHVRLNFLQQCFHLPLSSLFLAAIRVSLVRVEIRFTRTFEKTSMIIMCVVNDESEQLFHLSANPVVLRQVILNVVQVGHRRSTWNF